MFIVDGNFFQVSGRPDFQIFQFHIHIFIEYLDQRFFQEGAGNNSSFER